MRSTPSPVHLYNNDIIYEIFTWLPAKSLVRFKSINKYWNTKIASDSYFTQLHWRRAGTRRRGEKLLLHCLDNSIVDDNCLEDKFISIDKDGRNRLPELYSIHSCPIGRDKMIVVDGFVCLYSGFSTSLHNLSTHESISLPEDSNFNKEFGKKTFLFIGFDSSHTLCKILRKIDPTGYEIYTVGGASNSWRIIKSPPFECLYCKPYDCGICINGVIYWISWCCTIEKNSCFKGFNIKAFDVSDEKFYLISIPYGCKVDHLMNVDGFLTLMDKRSCLSRSGYEVKLQKLKDYKNQAWVVESIVVDFAPTLLISKVEPVMVGTICSGEILIIQQLEGGIMALIYYDRERRTSKVVEVHSYYDREVLGTYVENIMPLTLISN